jgi:hypothetical protein
MTHLSEEDLLDMYYGDSPQGAGEHVKQCPGCRGELARITELLNEVRNVTVPPRGEGYGREVWARLQPRFPVRTVRWWVRPWVLAPAGVALLTATFFAGMLTMRHQQGAITQPSRTLLQAGLSEKDSRRVFLGVMNDHLERTEILLVQLTHADSSPADIPAEQARARDLLEENRLLRETAARCGDQAHAALLEDLERVFLDLANSPVQLSANEVAELRRRVENQGLLFKVRVSSEDARSKGQTL